MKLSDLVASTKVEVPLKAPKAPRKSRHFTSREWKRRKVRMKLAKESRRRNRK